MSHHLSFSRTALATLLATTLSAGLIGCSSDDDGGTASTTIDGSAFASAVDGANCQILNANNDNVIVDGITTSADGTFTATISNPSLAGDLMLTCTGGTYTDEADGSAQTAGTLAAYAVGGTLSADAGFNATPGSTIVYQLINQHGMTPVLAQNAFQNAFGYTPDVTAAPTDATNPASGSSLAALEAGLHAATFSQLTKDLLLTPDQQFLLLEEIAADLSDGIQDGLNGGVDTLLVPALIGDKFITASNNFRTRTVQTATYRIGYVPGMMTAMEGKTQFSVSITDSASGLLPAVSQTVSVMPMMYMDGYSHSAAVDGACVETIPDTSGIYDCTVYYSMGSRMMDGSSMGEWDIKVMVGGMTGESAHFYPEVMMAMSDTKLAKLKNSEDTITDMDGVATARNFLLYRSALSFNLVDNTYALELFTATMESMMSFPAVTSTTTLNADTMNQLDIVSMDITVSADPTFTTFVTATESANGYWTATGITGLNQGVQDEIYVRMNINGLDYNNSIDGVFVDEATTPSHATFAINVPVM